MSMRALSTSSRGPVTLLPHRYGEYRPAKERWWPLFALLGAGGACVLALLPTPQQSDDARSTQKSLVYSVIGSGALANANPLLRPLFLMNRPTINPWRETLPRQQEPRSGIRPGLAHRRTVMHTRRGTPLAEKLSVMDAMAGIPG